MSFSEIMLWVAAAGVLLGALDRIFGNKLGLGKQLEEGLNCMGPLALTMAGLMCLAPAAAELLGSVCSPVLRALGCDPALVGAILPNDTGGYPLALALADDPEAAAYVGLIVASMFGCTLTFTLPLGVNVLRPCDRPYFIYGMLLGIICTPFGSVIGGLVGGFSFRLIWRNTLPILVLSVLLALGLKFFPVVMMKICTVFAKIISALATLGLAAGGITYLTGVQIIPSMGDMGEALGTIGGIGLVLMGMFPILSLLTRLLKKPLEKIGSRVGLEGTAAADLLINLCNALAVLPDIPNMSSFGKICNFGFMVCATAALGDHLGYTAGVDAAYIPAVVAGKLAGGLLTLLLCFLFGRHTAALDRESAKLAEQASSRAKAGSRK